MLDCTRCGRSGEAPPAHRVAAMGALKDRLSTSICASCWQEWEGMEIKVINEYRLNFMEPEHRDRLRRACADFFQIS